jgi:nucleoside-diphosphate-sugar epimerase
VIASRRLADFGGAVQALGWKPSISVEEGVEDIVRAARAAS